MTPSGAASVARGDRLGFAHSVLHTGDGVAGVGGRAAEGSDVGGVLLEDVDDLVDLARGGTGGVAVPAVGGVDVARIVGRGDQLVVGRVDRPDRVLQRSRVPEGGLCPRDHQLAFTGPGARVVRSVAAADSC
jgi:hypothetical protein